jgi:hypothetical protein
MADADDEKTAKRPPGKTDVVLLGPPTSDGEGVHVLRAREERVETGELRAMKEGKPITGEVVALEPRKENPRVCDVKSSYSPPAKMLSEGIKKGPAQVATKQYRENWDEVFASRDRSLN